MIEVINGRSVAHYPAHELEEIEYRHLQLAAHDVIFAEGAACDSLRAGSIGEFDNKAEALLRSDQCLDAESVFG